MVDALPCLALISPHTGHLHPPPGRPVRHIHHHGRDRAGSRGLLPADLRGGRGLSLRPHGHPVPTVRPGGRGGHSLRGAAPQRDRLAARVAGGPGPRGRRRGEKVGEAVLWDLDGVFVRVRGGELVDDAAAGV